MRDFTAKSNLENSHHVGNNDKNSKLGPPHSPLCLVISFFVGIFGAIILCVNEKIILDNLGLQPVIIIAGLDQKLEFFSKDCFLPGVGCI